MGVGFDTLPTPPQACIRAPLSICPATLICSPHCPRPPLPPFAGMHTGSIVHLPSNLDLLTTAARRVRSYSVDFREMEIRMQPLDPAGSSRRAHSYSSRASPGEKVLQQRRPSSSQTLFTPAPAYGPLPPRAPSPLSAASAVAQRHREDTATRAVAGLRAAAAACAPPGDSSSNAFREGRAHGSCNALNMRSLGAASSGTGAGAPAVPGGSGTGAGAGAGAAVPRGSGAGGSVPVPAAAAGHFDGGRGRQPVSGHRGGLCVASFGRGSASLLQLNSYRIPLPISAADDGPKMRRSATEPCELPQGVWMGGVLESDFGA